MDGGPGDDLLIVDGADCVKDTEGSNTVVFTASSAGEFKIGMALGSAEEQFLTLTDAANTTVAIDGGFLGTVARFGFANGEEIDLRTLLASAQVNQGFEITGSARADNAYGGTLC